MGTPSRSDAAVFAFKPFPVDVLPEPIRSFVADAAKSIGCDPSFVALPLLSGLASAIGNTYRIALKPSWSEPAIVWTVIVGESGSHKTPAFKAAMGSIRKFQDQAFKEHLAALAEFESQQVRYEAEFADWTRQGSNKRGNPPEKPTPPVSRRYFVSDTTTEALAPILRDNPRGVLLARDELAGWLGSFDRYAKAGRGGADSAHWLSMHNGEAMTIDRKTGVPPTIHVPSASVSIAGCIQPGILARALGQEHRDSGMLARLLFAKPPEQVKTWTEANVNADTEEAVAMVFGQLLGLTPEADDNGDERPRLLPLTDDGKQAWVTFYNEHAKEQAELSGDLSAAWSKLEGYAPRLALVIHLTRWAAGDSSVPTPTTLIDEKSIAGGVKLVKWFGNETRRVYSVLSESDADRSSRRLLELIQRRGGKVSGREVVQNSRDFKTVDAAESALAALVKAGLGKWQSNTESQRGRPPSPCFVLSSLADANVYESTGE